MPELNKHERQMLISMRAPKRGGAPNLMILLEMVLRKKSQTDRMTRVPASYPYRNPVRASRADKNLRAGSGDISPQSGYGS
jgi:hypothetical protein